MIIDIDKINKKITEKIEKGEFSKNIKNFLRDILIFEFIHFEEAKPWYMDKYEELINKYTNKNIESGIKEK